jgi:hypothetical protein
MTVTNTSLIVLLLSRCYSARARAVHPATAAILPAERLRRL